MPEEEPPLWLLRKEAEREKRKAREYLETVARRQQIVQAEVSRQRKRVVTVQLPPSFDTVPYKAEDDRSVYAKPIYSKRRTGEKSVLQPHLEKEEKIVEKITKPLGEKQVQLHAKSVELAEKGRPWEGFGYYMAGTGLRFTRGFVEGVTFPVRPIAWGQTVSGLSKLVTSPEARGELIGEVARDPFGFAAEAGGGIAGGYTFGKGISIATRKPSGFTLKQVKVPKETSSPASIVPRGSWPTKAFDVKLWREGGTPVIQLVKEPKFVLIHKPLPVYEPSYLPSVLGVAGGTRIVTGLKEKTENHLRAPSGIPQVSGSTLRERQIQDTVLRPKIGSFPVPIQIEPVGYKEKSPPMLRPGYIEKTVPKLGTRTSQMPGQVQAPRQVRMARSIPAMKSISLTDLSPRPLRLETVKTRRRTQGLQEIVFGEERRYKVADISKMLEGI
jgi:hypothetical protein